MIGAVLQTLLSGVGDLYPGRATQTAKMPFMTYEVVNVESYISKRSTVGVHVYRIQIHIFSEQLTDCDTYSNAILAILENYRGTVGTTVVNSIRYQLQNDQFDDAAQVYNRTIEYTIRINVS